MFRKAIRESKLLFEQQEAARLKEPPETTVTAMDAVVVKKAKPKSNDKCPSNCNAVADARDKDVQVNEEPIRNKIELKQQNQPIEETPVVSKIPKLPSLEKESVVAKPKYYCEKDGVPVFEPDYETFKDFYQFALAIERYGMRAGLVKIIPPPEWKDTFEINQKLLETFQIQPIRQKFRAGGGLPYGSYRQINTGVTKKYSVQDWASACKGEFAPPENISSKSSLPPKKRYQIDHENKACERNPKDEVASEKENVCSKDIDYMNDFNEKRPLEYFTALERHYWRNVSFSKTMYGADLQGSLFVDKAENSWNIGKLESVLTKVDTPIPGVTTPYLYFGMYKATFAWHVEDMDLSSINYIHFGAAKQWYVVPPSSRAHFQKLARMLYADEASYCSEFIRHKGCVISPSILSEYGIPCHKVVQHANEIIITYPGAYHQGYNTGFNCAESVNFATPGWFEFAKTARFCECVDYSVQMDVTGLFGIETENPVCDDDEIALNRKSKKRGRKTKSSTESNDFSKKPKAERPVLPDPKCYLCPLGSTEQFPLFPTDMGDQLCHLECGAYINETTVEIINLESKNRDSDSQQVVETAYSTDPVENINSQTSFIEESDIGLVSYKICGLKDVPIDRRRLKCNMCQWTGPQSVHLGACIQCTKGKCVRSYHVTCAILGGINVNLDDDGIFTAYCFAHDPVSITNEVLREQKKQDAASKVAETGNALFPPGTPVIAKIGNSSYEGLVVEKIVEKNGCLVQFEGNEDPCFTPWQNLKLKPIETQKIKKVPVYSDTRPKKNAMKLLYSQLLEQSDSTTIATSAEIIQ